MSDFGCPSARSPGPHNVKNKTKKQRHQGKNTRTLFEPISAGVTKHKSTSRHISSHGHNCFLLHTHPLKALISASSSSFHSLPVQGNNTSAHFCCTSLLLKVNYYKAHMSLSFQPGDCWKYSVWGPGNTHVHPKAAWKAHSCCLSMGTHSTPEKRPLHGHSDLLFLNAIKYPAAKFLISLKYLNRFSS